MLIVENISSTASGKIDAREPAIGSTGSWSYLLGSRPRLLRYGALNEHCQSQQCQAAAD